MALSRRDDDGAEGPPFLLRLFYRTGYLIRADDFARHEFPAPHVDVYARFSTTLADLTLELASAAPQALPEVVSGTRLAYQLVYPSPPSAHAPSSAGRSSHHPPSSRARYMAEDFGSVVIGGDEGGMQGYAPSHDGIDDPRARLSPRAAGETGRKSERTLGDARFVVGDFLVAAILPALEDGGVAPAEAAKKELKDRAGHGAFRDHGGFGNGRRGGRRGGGGAASGVPPVGDWRRGEPLPDTWERRKPRRAW